MKYGRMQIRRQTRLYLMTAGGKENSGSDNAINGDGSGAPGDSNPLTDEDNEDPAGLEVLDIALFKKLDSTGTAFPLRYTEAS